MSILKLIAEYLENSIKKLKDDQRYGLAQKLTIARQHVDETIKVLEGEAKRVRVVAESKPVAENTENKIIWQQGEMW